MKRATGFTVTETLVVLAIVVLIFAAVLPVVAPMRRHAALNSAGSDIMGAFREGRAVAITLCGRGTVEYSGDRTLRLSYAAYDGTSLKVLANTSRDKVTWVDTIKLESISGFPVIFDADGTCQRSARLVIFHPSQPDELRVISVAGNGHAQIARVQRKDL